MPTTMNRTGRHLNMRPVVRPRPRPSGAVAGSLTW
jgi:hypothetical protein